MPSMPAVFVHPMYEDIRFPKYLNVNIFKHEDSDMAPYERVEQLFDERVTYFIYIALELFDLNWFQPFDNDLVIFGYDVDYDYTIEAMYPQVDFKKMIIEEDDSLHIISV